MSTSVDMTTCSRCGHRNPSWYAACEQCGARLSLASSDYALKRKAVMDNRGPGPGAVTSQAPKLSFMAHAMCGWPLILVAIGGLIGGALGAAAYAINLAIYKSGIAPTVVDLLDLGEKPFTHVTGDGTSEED